MRLAALLLTASLASAETGSIAGQVLDSLRKPLQDVVALVDSSTALTGPDGTFRVVGVRPGRHTVKLVHKQFLALSIASVDVAEGQQRVLPPVQLQDQLHGSGCDAKLDYIRFLPSAEQNGSFGGIVVDRPFHSGPGVPLPNVSVKMLCGRRPCALTRTDAGGEFHFPDVPSASSFVFSKPGYYVEHFDFEVKAGREQVYGPIGMERCQKGDCDPQRRLVPICD